MRPSHVKGTVARKWNNLDNVSYIGVRGEKMEALELKQMFPQYLRDKWAQVARQTALLQEIRLRAGKPVVLKIENKEYFLYGSGSLGTRGEMAEVMEAEDIQRILNHLCQYSLYAYEEELKQGFFTIRGGHRVGVAGQVVTEGGQIKTIKYVSCMNIRIAHAVKGAANSVMGKLYEGGNVLNTMIISNPGCGKTTLLRDIIRQISDGNLWGAGRTVGVVDERSEIGGSYQGIPQNDVGIRTDILDACPKAQGMMILIRAMAPEVVAVDEIGGGEDIHALRQVLQCGCRMLVTIHGESLEEVRQKPHMAEIMGERIFDRYILLGKRENSCRIEALYDGAFRTC